MSIQNLSQLLDAATDHGEGGSQHLEIAVGSSMIMLQQTASEPDWAGSWVWSLLSCEYEDLASGAANGVLEAYAAADEARRGPPSAHERLESMMAMAV